jgi:hypothetical protein
MSPVDRQQPPTLIGPTNASAAAESPTITGFDHIAVRKKRNPRRNARSEKKWTIPQTSQQIDIIPPGRSNTTGVNTCFADISERSARGWTTEAVRRW